MSIDPAEFKKSLSHWASGVSVITYAGHTAKGGLTVSSFSSLSLDPPLVLFCLAASSQGKLPILETKRFAVNVLSESQKELSGAFASAQDKGTVLESASPFLGKTGTPLLPNCLTNLDCELEEMKESGDHTIVIGRVVWVQTPGGKPLLYFNKGYHTLG